MTLQLGSRGYLIGLLSSNSKFFQSHWLSSSFPAGLQVKVTDQPMRWPLALLTTCGLSSCGQEVGHMDGGVGATLGGLEEAAVGAEQTHLVLECTAPLTDVASFKAGPGSYSVFVVPSPHWSVMEPRRCPLWEQGVLPDGEFICF